MQAKAMSHWPSGTGAQIEERRLVTENAVLLKRILDAEAEAARQERHNARLVAERDKALNPVALVPRSRR